MHKMYVFKGFVDFHGAVDRTHGLVNFKVFILTKINTRGKIIFKDESSDLIGVGCALGFYVLSVRLKPWLRRLYFSFGFSPTCVHKPDGCAGGKKQKTTSAH